MKIYLRSLFLMALVFAVGCREKERWLLALGYTPIRPASTLLMPGALVMRSQGSNDAVRLVCDQRTSLGKDFAPITSNTINGKFKRTKNMAWHVKGDVLAQAKASANAKDVKDVYVEVQNARILHVSDDLIYSNVANRHPACAAAIQARKDAGYSISMVKSALVGDVSYKFTFNNSEDLDAQIKIAQAANLAVTLGGSVDTASEETASASNLVWGIQEDMYLAAISVSPEEAKRYKRNTRMLPSNFVIEAAPAAEGPVSGAQRESKL